MIFFIQFFGIAFDTTGNEWDDLIYLGLALAIIIPLSLINNVAFFIKTSLLANFLIIITLLDIFGNDLY